MPNIALLGDGRACEDSSESVRRPYPSLSSYLSQVSLLTN